jgi:hypothetical protein
VDGAPQDAEAGLNVVARRMEGIVSGAHVGGAEGAQASNARIYS